ncbi:MAG: hypothetical protein V4622_08925 [Bacteroidota bacterium]
MRVLILFLFFTSISYSQNKVKVVSKVSIEFENFKDTVFRGFQNAIYLKGLSDLKGITIEGINATVSLSNKERKMFLVIPSRASKTCELIVKKNNKEIYRRNVVISNLGGKQLEILEKKRPK